MLRWDAYRGRIMSPSLGDLSALLYTSCLKHLNKQPMLLLCWCQITISSREHRAVINPPATQAEQRWKTNEPPSVGKSAKASTGDGGKSVTAVFFSTSIWGCYDTQIPFNVCGVISLWVVRFIFITGFGGRCDDIYVPFTELPLTHCAVQRQRF